MSVCNPFEQLSALSCGKKKKEREREKKFIICNSSRNLFFIDVCRADISTTHPRMYHMYHIFS